MPKMMTHSRYSFVGHWQKITLLLLLMVSVCWFFADTEVIALDPWSELGRMWQGFVHPDFFATEYLLLRCLGLRLGCYWDFH